MREPKDIRLKTHLVDECNHAGKSRSRATGALNRENLKAGVCSTGRRVSPHLASTREHQRRRQRTTGLSLPVGPANATK